MCSCLITSRDVDGPTRLSLSRLAQRRVQRGRSWSASTIIKLTFGAVELGSSAVFSLSPLSAWAAFDRLPLGVTFRWTVLNHTVWRPQDESASSRAVPPRTRWVSDLGIALHPFVWIPALPWRDGCSHHDGHSKALLCTGSDQSLPPLCLLSSAAAKRFPPTVQQCVFCLF